MASLAIQQTVSLICRLKILSALRRQWGCTGDEDAAFVRLAAWGSSVVPECTIDRAPGEVTLLIAPY